MSEPILPIFQLGVGGGGRRGVTSKPSSWLTISSIVRCTWGGGGWASKEGAGGGQRSDDPFGSEGVFSLSLSLSLSLTPVFPICRTPILPIYQRIFFVLFSPRGLDKKTVFTHTPFFAYVTPHSSYISPMFVSVCWSSHPHPFSPYIALPFSPYISPAFSFLFSEPAAPTVVALESATWLTKRAAPLDPHKVDLPTPQPYPPNSPLALPPPLTPP